MKLARIVIAFAFAIGPTASASLHAQINTVAGVPDCIQKGAQGQNTSWTNTCATPVTFQLFAFNTYLGYVVPAGNQVLQPGGIMLSDHLLTRFIYFVCPSGYAPGKSGTVGLAVDAQTTSYQCFPY
jgi:hypothetical protein